MGTPASEPSPNQVDEFEPKGSILVVGSTGKLGRLIVRELLERGYEVLALVSSEERAEKVRG
jgi:NAD(P)-dependent dehydrogenase (short-subunit alcohol dehydrogenase family)